MTEIYSTWFGFYGILILLCIFQAPTCFEPVKRTIPKLFLNSTIAFSICFEHSAGISLSSHFNYKYYLLHPKNISVVVSALLPSIVFGCKLSYFLSFSSHPSTYSVCLFGAQSYENSVDDVDISSIAVTCVHMLDQRELNGTC